MPVMSITEKGQVVIPKELREKYGIATNAEVIVTEIEDHIAVLRAKTTLEGIKRLSIEILPAGESECLEAGDIKARFKLSLADAFVAALGKLYDAQILTGDPEFKPLEAVGEIRVLWLPQK